MFKQIVAVTGLTIRSIPQRWGMSLATVLSVALVVGVLMAFLAMANGFSDTLAGTGAKNVVVALRKGSQAELNSGISRDQVRLIREAPGLWRDSEGKTLVSAELYVIVDGTKKSTGTQANLPLRGVEPGAMRLRKNMKIIQGRMFTPGSNEIIVGQGVMNEVTDFQLEKESRIGSNTWKVVGIFSTGGSAFESEIWADAGVIQNLYRRGGSYQSVRARLQMPDGLKKFQEWAKNEPKVDIDAVTEQKFFADQATVLSTIIKFMGWPLAIVMSIGALAGAWNTLYASVDSRTREIATLRTLGFGGFPVLVATMIEALLLSFTGGVIGAVVAYFMFNGMTAATFGASFTQVVFSFAVTPKAVLNGIILALIVGFQGGIVPSIRAARIPLLAAQ